MVNRETKEDLGKVRGKKKVLGKRIGGRGKELAELTGRKVLLWAQES